MVLRSFGFMREVDLSVWGILSGMPRQEDCAVELAEAYLKGKVKLESPGVEDRAFNICAYSSKVDRNRRLYSYRRDSKVLHITDGGEETEAYGVSDAEVSRAADQRDAYSEVDDEDEQRYVARELEAMYRDLLCTYHVDLWCCLKMALLGVPDAIRELKCIADDAPCFSGLLRELLSGGNLAISMCLQQAG